LLNALRVVGKELSHIRIAMIGMGAAGIPTYRFLKAAGVPPESVIACDLGGILHKRRRDYEQKQEEYAEQWKVCQESNADGITGGIREAMRGADVCIAFSTPGPGIIESSWVKTMARDGIVFACANPIPEIWPWEAQEAGARIVCTGRSDVPNQVNNSLVFPAIFRGTLDVRARTITDEMAIAAAHELAACAQERGLSDTSILPRMDEWEVVPRVAAVTALKAQEQGIARLARTREELVSAAAETIKTVRQTTSMLMEKGFIRPMPAGL
jgi:malate dehydrogenase (oxaloacetate-decarboxylating)